MHRKGRRRKRYDEAGLGVGSEIELRDTGREAAEHPRVKSCKIFRMTMEDESVRFCRMLTDLLVVRHVPDCSWYGVLGLEIKR